MCASRPFDLKSFAIARKVGMADIQAFYKSSLIIVRMNVKALVILLVVAASFWPALTEHLLLKAKKPLGLNSWIVISVYPLDIGPTVD